MCGSATLAIVVSSACMIVASMIEIVIMPRCGIRRWSPRLIRRVSRLAAHRPAGWRARAAACHQLLALGGAEAGQRALSCTRSLTANAFSSAASARGCSSMALARRSVSLGRRVIQPAASMRSTSVATAIGVRSRCWASSACVGGWPLSLYFDLADEAALRARQAQLDARQLVELAAVEPADLVDDEADAIREFAGFFI